MCDLCSGTAIEDVLAKLHTQILSRGFAILPVGTTAEKNGWAYTIGLVESKDHPELVVAGHPLGDAVAVLNEVGQAVAMGARLGVNGDRFSPEGAEFGFVPVHPRHLRGELMSAWRWYYEGIGRRDLEPRALQVLVPDAAFGYPHPAPQPRLDAGRHVAFDGLSRQERRGHPAGGRTTAAG